MTVAALSAVDAIALAFFIFALGALFGVCVTLARLGYVAPPLPACPRCGLLMLPYRPAWAEPKQLPLFAGAAGA